MFDGEAPSRFESDGMGFLIAYAKRSQGVPFSAEEVTLAMIDAGIAPQELRHVGPLFPQAARDGYIRRSTVAFRRVFGHGSKTLGWEAV